MPFPIQVDTLPSVDIPFPPEVVTSRAIRSNDGLVVFFTFHQDVELPAHSHGDQCGMVLQGRIDLTLDGVERTFSSGESYDIPAGTVHGAKVHAGSTIIDIFAEPDRYPLKRQ